MVATAAAANVFEIRFILIPSLDGSGSASCGARPGRGTARAARLEDTERREMP
jgi:hypothetical protein